MALLNHMQDVIGDWHDWVQLADRAEKLFGGVQDSAAGSCAAQHHPRQVPPGGDHSY